MTKGILYIENPYCKAMRDNCANSQQYCGHEKDQSLSTHRWGGFLHGVSIRAQINNVNLLTDNGTAVYRQLCRIQHYPANPKLMIRCLTPR